MTRPRWGAKLSSVALYGNPKHTHTKLPIIPNMKLITWHLYSKEIIFKLGRQYGTTGYGKVTIWENKRRTRETQNAKCIIMVGKWEKDNKRVRKFALGNFVWILF